MKKKLIALVLVCCMAVALAACGGGGNPAPSDPSPDTAPPAGTDQSQPSDTPAEPEKVSLTVWSPSEDQNPDLGAWLVTMCDKFNELHPEGTSRSTTVSAPSPRPRAWCPRT